MRKNVTRWIAALLAVMFMIPAPGAVFADETEETQVVTVESETVETTDTADASEITAEDSTGPDVVPEAGEEQTAEKQHKNVAHALQDRHVHVAVGESVSERGEKHGRKEQRIAADHKEIKVFFYLAAVADPCALLEEHL